MARKRSIEVYLKEGVDEEDALYSVWQALGGRRRQEFFRRVLRYGIAGAIERGDLPRFAASDVDWSAIDPNLGDFLFTPKNRRVTNSSRQNTVKSGDNAVTNLDTLVDQISENASDDTGDINRTIQDESLNEQEENNKSKISGGDNEKKVVKSPLNVSKSNMVRYSEDKSTEQVDAASKGAVGELRGEGDAPRKCRLGKLM